MSVTAKPTSPAPGAPAPQSSRPASEPRRTPWVQLKTYCFHPCIFPAMIRGASPDAKPGSLVQVYDKDGKPFGAGLYNPRARVPLRVLYHGPDPFGEAQLLSLLDRAIDLRHNLLDLPARTDAFRAINSDGDTLSGLIVDRYADVLSVEVHSLGVFQRLPKWLPHLHQRLGTRHAVVEVDPAIARFEGISPGKVPSDAVRTVRIQENRVRYEVNFEQGHKTGFFCDQRENRRRFAAWARGRSTLDLCCYTGGFALAAKVLGEAGETTGVDLDEAAVAQSRRNANLNQVRIEWVHCDAFTYARQMQLNGRRWEAIVLDPPKLILSRDDQGEGWRKYEDLNQLGIRLAAPGALFVTCSCSGLLTADDFEQIVVRAAHRESRRLQILDRTGAAEDHPVLSTAPEGRYLKTLWARVW